MTSWSELPATIRTSAAATSSTPRSNTPFGASAAFLTPADLENTVVLAHDGVPVLVRDIGRWKQFRFCAMARRCRTLGKPSPRRSSLLKARTAEPPSAASKLGWPSYDCPDGYRLRPFYDQSEIINGTIHTVLHNLLEAGLLVTVILLFFLGDLRAALIVAMMIPLSILFGFMGMAIFGVSANLMSLGAIDFGMIVDGSVVMIENSVHHLEKSRRERDGRWTPSARRRMKSLARFCLAWPLSSRCICRSSLCKAWKEECSGPWRSPCARLCSAR